MIPFEFILYLSVLLLGIVSGVFLLFKLRKSEEKLPIEWKKSQPLRNFRLSILFFSLFLFINFIFEFISILFSLNGIYNGYIMTINATLSLPFFHLYLFINTQTNWKRFSYLILYVLPLFYYIINGHYHPRCVLYEDSVFVYYVPCFLGSSIYLTDLLLNPKSPYFRFQLKINLSVLFFTLLAMIITPFYWHMDSDGSAFSQLIYYIHTYNATLYYFILAVIFIREILKLYHKKGLLK